MTCDVDYLNNPRLPLSPELISRSEYDLSNDHPSNQLIEGLVNESLNIAAANINIYKLLGIHEQHRLVDLIGNGASISSGEYPEFPSNNVVMNDVSEWRSTQRGTHVISGAYIGYDFGPIRLDTGRLQYGVETEVKHHITSIMIQQGCEPQNRATRIRIERSDNGIKWYGAALVDLPDDYDAHWLNIKQSAPSRYWRFSPQIFNGGPKDFWTVRRISLSECTKTDITNMQFNDGFFENRDRSYSTEPISIKGYYDFVEVQTELARFGIELNNQFVFKFSFSAIVRALGRPIIIGDVLEIPSEIQYDINMQPVKKYLEVTDVSWASNGFTPGWVPTLYQVIAQPMIASQETQDIVGDLNLPSTDNDFFNLKSSIFNTGNLTEDRLIRAESNTLVPEVGTDTANDATFPGELVKYGQIAGVRLDKINLDQRAIYVEDGLPPNGAAYTEGPSYPTDPKNNDYHRLTYVGLNDPIPPRLFRYSLAKMRWVFMEEDKRMRSNSKKPQLTQYIDNGVDVITIGK